LNDITFTVIGNGHIGKRHMEIIEGIEARKSPESRQEGLDVVLIQQPTAKSQEPEARSQELLTAICTPNYLHCTQAIEAMRAGHDVIIEKPMGLKAAECREVIKVAKELDRKVFCVMQNRFSPPSKWLKEMIGSGRLGKIYQVQVNCFWNRNEDYYKQSKWKGKLAMDGGTLYTQFSHFIDTLFWLFGDIEPVGAQFFNFNHPYIEFEDSGIVQFFGHLLVHADFGDKKKILGDEKQSFVGQINYSTSAYEQNLESSITILAEYGTVKVGGQYMEKILACNVKDYEMPILAETQPPNDYGTYKGSASNHVYVYENILDVLAGKADIACTAEEGLKVVEFIEKVYAFRADFSDYRR